MTEPDDPPPPAAEALPPLDGDAPLHELGRDELSAFLYEALVGEELLALMRELDVTIPGYRREALHDAARADALADTVRAQPAARQAVIAKLREAYEFPALESVVLPQPVADELALLAVESDAPVRMLWRLLADPSAPVRAAGRRALQELARALYGPAPEGTAEAPAEPAAPKSEAAADREAQKEARAARAQAERARDKAEGLKAQLKALRTELAEAQKQAAAHRRTAERLDVQLQRTQQQLKDAKAKPQRAALDEARRQVEELSARAAALEERQGRTAEERDALEQQLQALRREHGEALARPQPAAPAGGEDEAPAEAPSTWTLPRFSREFYDSLEGWDARIQRAAFKRAMLLADNHRHPSLRAIPLEGLPGYFRVRIATDVRLIYRRGERDRDVELLSLIDREDLDRYVRQAKTR